MMGFVSFRAVCMFVFVLVRVRGYVWCELADYENGDGREMIARLARIVDSGRKST